MASSKFEFKQFTVWHNECAMKVGTDSVVLGASVNLNQSMKRALDVGTGSGVLALMLAQNHPNLLIDAIEIDSNACRQASENFSISPWKERLQSIETSLQNFTKETHNLYDCIVSNPPFFVTGSNFTIENEARSKARHDNDLSFQDLAIGVNTLLSENGEFWLILPVLEAVKFKDEASKNHLFLSKEIQIYPKPGKPIKRLIQVYKKQPMTLVQTELFLQNEAGKPSKEYIDISKEFYLRIDL
jgi:tRNA1Val (adenine37-N6)-methyltransferase